MSRPYSVKRSTAQNPEPAHESHPPAATLPQLGEGLRGACGLLAGLLFSLSVGVSNGQPADQLEDPALPSPLTAWNLFPLGLEWVGNTVPSDEETLELQAVLEGDYPDAADGLVGGIEAFISAWPDSAYVPSLRTQLALYYRRTCRYSLALDHWQRAWLQTSHLANGAGKSVADRTLVEWALLLANLGHHEALGDLIGDAAERFLDGGLLADRWQRAVEAFQAMRNYPEAGSGCGLWALDQLAKAMGLVPSERGLLMDTPTPREGLSLLDLERLSTEHGLRLRAIRSRAGQAIPVPSIVHWNQEHYAVVLEHRRGWLAVGDPAAGGRVWITPEQLLAEATGYFLTAESPQDADWAAVSASEGAQVIGRVVVPPFYLGWRDDEDGVPADLCPAPSPAGYPMASPNSLDPLARTPDVSTDRPLRHSGPDGSQSRGMLSYRLSEPFLNLWLVDEPFYYQPPRGPEIVLRLAFRQRAQETIPYLETYGGSSFGPGWHASWVGWADLGLAYFPDGRLARYSYPPTGNLSNRNYDDNSRQEILRNVHGNVIGYQVHLSDGSRLRYTHSSNNPHARYYLTAAIDPHGITTTFQYSANRLTQVIDADNNFTQLSYSHPTLANLVTSLSGPGGRQVTLGYDALGRLESITDMAGLQSTVGYDNATGWPTSFTTPYGQTTFSLAAGVTGGMVVDRKATITEPENYHRVFGLAAVGPATMPGNFQSPQLPGSTPFAASGHPYGTMETANRSVRNSYYLGPVQAATPGMGTALENFTWEKLKQTRIRHWLISDQDQGGAYHLKTLNHEQSPSPDAYSQGQSAREGQITWFDYEGKNSTAKQLIGSQSLPAVVARTIPGVSPDQPWYVYHPRNYKGNPTAETTTYTTTAGAWNTRSRTFSYAANGMDLMTERNFNGETVRTYTYDSARRPLTATEHPANGVSYTTTYTYDTQGRLKTWQTPAGQTRTYNYHSYGFLSNFTESPLARTESFTWVNQQLHTHTDARGLVRTFTFDPLGRLTRIDYPDTTYRAFRYTADGTVDGPKILDLTWERDRLGHLNRYVYNGQRQMTQHIDPRGNPTEYEYCGCGGIATIKNALDQITTFMRDPLDQVIQVIYPDNTTVGYEYNLLGQLVAETDALGLRTFGYNNQGLLATNLNAFGQTRRVRFDINDQPWEVTDANGVTTTTTFDRLGRPLSRTWPDTGIERYLYTAPGLVAHTNQLAKVTRIEYNQLGRKTAETNANLEVIRYTYNPAGDLLTLRDGKNQVTTWAYDRYGQVTNKLDQASAQILRYQYDAAGRLTNRWSAAKGNTAYTYDDAGNLTFVTYPTTYYRHYTYDALNRVDTMVDQVGTSQYTYHDNGLLQTENGPWANDTVTYSYHPQVPHLRTGLTLQQPSGSWSQTYGYDAAKRLSTVGGTAGTHTYTYRGAGTLWTNLALPNTSRITNAYDTVGRLTQTRLRNSGGTALNTHSYVYNLGHERTRQTRTDASTVDYTYDHLGQLIRALGSGGQSTENLGYGYDVAWNLNKRTNGVTVHTFTVDVKNQLVSTPYGTCTYDSNGNLTNDGAGRTFTYDAENQLTSVGWGGGNYRTDFVYDGRGRMRKRLDYYYSGGAWSVTSQSWYLYDGMRIVQERSGSNVPTTAYAWGQDLSGSFEGAGGIGGLLARSDQYSSGSWGRRVNAHADGNGNVTALIDSAQALIASYTYNPYGQLTASSGALASANKIRFSTKLWFDSINIYYYGYRFYDPILQRWMNRDPVGESYGINLFRFAAHNPISLADALGLHYGGTGYDCQKKCGDEFDACMLDRPKILKQLGGYLTGVLLWCKQLSATSFVEGFAVGTMWNTVDCGSTYFGCMSGCPAMLPYPVAPPGSGCSLCPVNSPPFLDITIPIRTKNRSQAE